MSKKILLVGHCGPDSSFLRMTIKSAAPDAQILSADDEDELTKAMETPLDLLLFNRELGYGFGDQTGIDVIRRLKAERADLKMMLVSNYSDAQAAAHEAGALPGFGKRELGSARVAQLLKHVLA